MGGISILFYYNDSTVPKIKNKKNSYITELHIATWMSQSTKHDNGQQGQNTRRGWWESHYKKKKKKHLQDNLDQKNLHPQKHKHLPDKTL